MPRALLAVLLAGLLAGCGGSSGSDAGDAGETGATAAERVTAISNVLQLRAAFNEDAGKPRLLLILSPT